MDDSVFHIIRLRYDKIASVLQVLAIRLNKFTQ